MCLCTDLYHQRRPAGRAFLNKRNRFFTLHAGDGPRAVSPRDVVNVGIFCTTVRKVEQLGGKETFIDVDKPPSFSSGKQGNPGLCYLESMVRLHGAIFSLGKDDYES